MSAPDTHYTKTADGMAIAYQTVGEGPDIVFLPLFGCIDMIWEDPEYEYLLRRLAGMGRLILFDVRGNGASDPLPFNGLPTPQRWMDDMRAVLDAVGSTEATIFASALYGVMAMCFAATYPERTRSLVLLDSYARWLQADDYPFGGTPEGSEFLARYMEETWGKGLTAASTPSRANDVTFQRWVARTERLGATPGEIGLYWSWAMQLDVRDVLPVIQAPTLVIYLTPNNVFRIEHSQYLVEHIPDARLIEIERKQHYLFDRREGDRVLDQFEEFLTGAPPVRPTDTSLSTVFFSDIVDSTTHAIRLGDVEWADLVIKHDRLLVAHLEQHQGHKVVPTGDGLLATFDGPERAIRCAQAACEAVRDIGLEVRVGLHTGEIQRRGDNIHGLAVHIGARIVDLAQPNEVLVSSTVRDLVIGSNIEFLDRGAHSLKGVPEPQRVFAVA